MSARIDTHTDAANTETKCRRVTHHYATNEDLDRGITDGRTCMALCGHVFVPSFAHNAAGQGAPNICHECQRQYVQLAV